MNIEQIGVALLTVAIGIIGYFFRELHKQQKKNVEKIEKLSEQLTVSKEKILDSEGDLKEVIRSLEKALEKFETQVERIYDKLDDSFVRKSECAVLCISKRND